nr:hypothetical protein Iba_chr01fCG7640 [Ipomoea batatas]
MSLFRIFYSDRRNDGPSLFRIFDSDRRAVGFGVGGRVVEGHHREALVAKGELDGGVEVVIASDTEGGSVDLASEACWGLLADLVETRTRALCDASLLAACILESQLQQSLVRSEEYFDLNKARLLTLLSWGNQFEKSVEVFQQTNLRSFIKAVEEAVEELSRRNAKTIGRRGQSSISLKCKNHRKEKSIEYLPGGNRILQIRFLSGLQIPDCFDKWLHGSHIALISGCTALVSPKSALVARESPVSPKSNFYRSPKLDPRLLPTLSVQDALGRRRRS